jgi:RNA polymerase sigma factor (TIGR02999 family)
MNVQADITHILRDWHNGDSGAHDQLVNLIYPMLRRIASARLRGEGQSALQTTELVHETYLKLIDQQNTNWQDRNHFYAVASTLVRRILVDNARQRGSAKRGGGMIAVTFDDQLGIEQPEQMDWLALDTCLNQLQEIDPVAARLVELRFFTGLSIEDTADALNIGRSTAVRKWRIAKAYLQENWQPG